MLAMDNRGMIQDTQSTPMDTLRSAQPDRIFRFGPFELSEREGELRKNGVRIKLQEQPFRVLVELVATLPEFATPRGAAAETVAYRYVR